MRLVAEHDENRVVVMEDLERRLEVGSRMVRVESIPDLLRAVRQAARTLLPEVPVDPARMEHLATRIQSLALAAGALAEQAPEGDENAAKIRAALVELGLVQPA